MVLRRLSAGSGLLADAELEEIGEVIMKGKPWRIVHPSAPLIFLFLVVLTLAATPVAAQARPSCKNDAYVMGWDEDAASGTGFTMTRDCDIKTGSDINPLLVKSGKTFIIDGGGNTIYAADKASANDQGTAITLASGAGTLVLRNVTIEGGGDAATPTGGDADPAIIVAGGTLILDGATIQNTRGGAILVSSNDSKVLFKNATFTGNRTTANAAVISIRNGDNLYIEGLLTMKNNLSTETAIYMLLDGRIDLYDAGCIDLAGNLDYQDPPQSANIGVPRSVGFAAGFADRWRAKLKSNNNCDANTASTTTRPQGVAAPPTIPTATSTATVPAAPTPAAPANDDGSGGGDGDKSDQCILGTVGSSSVYCIARFTDGTVLLQIYRVDDNSEGHWVMNVSQAAIDAVSGAGCVAASPDGRYAVRVWADGNVTIYDGPDHESKVFHNTLKGGLSRTVISTETTYSSTPPGVGCPGYMG